ncbi:MULTISPECIES: sugar-binding protein [Paenibacillus]|uniref:sugar-binding protein n=1 Tax=Paenibacillus TaxID=44249 RepID=UPI000E280349|nr:MULTISPECIES: sugar-binding protein [Paenibacillus]MCM3001004.1 sugar-binding protein [Paenibacillus cellulositrophicus]RED33493.1 ribose transport system substrate-binding protein [Paenibacillus sp. VMFN-D1]
MLKRIWPFGLIVLVLIFAYILVRFFLASMTIGDLVGQIRLQRADDPSVKHVVLIAQELDNPFWREMEQGAEEAADKLGMRIDYTGPIRINPAEQMRLLERAIASGPDGILVQGIVDPDYDALIQRATGQGIPVITVDADEPGSSRLAYVGTDNLGAGKRMGELVLKEAAGKGKIGVMIGSEQAENMQLRLAGFRSVISAAPGFAIVDVRASNISRIGAAKQAEAMLKQHPDIQTIVGFSSLDAAGIVEGIQAAGRTGIRVYGFDDLAMTRQGIEQGEIAASIVQSPKEMGARSIGLLNEHFHGKSFAAEHFIPTSVLDKAALNLEVAGP